MRFIRKNGRIIPIRDGQDRYGTAKKLIVGGSAVKVTAVGAHLATLRHTKNISGHEFLSRYRKDYIAAGSPKITRVGKAGIKNYNAGVFLRHNEIFVGEKAQKEYVLLHELGHLKAANTQKIGFNKLGKHDIAAFGRKVTPIAGDLFTLGEEAEATGHAIHMAHKVGGVKEAAKIGSKLLAPYLSYMGAATLNAGVALAAYKWVTRPRKKK